jgi:hypothetical protein
MDKHKKDPHKLKYAKSNTPESNKNLQACQQCKLILSSPDDERGRALCPN